MSFSSYYFPLFPGLSDGVIFYNRGWFLLGILHVVVFFAVLGGGLKYALLAKSPSSVSVFIECVGNNVLIN